MSLSRREFLAASAAADLLRGQARSSRAIDLHHHFVSPAYVKALSAKEGHHMAGYTTWFAPPTIEYNTDTARAIFSLIVNDAATRYVNIRFIFSHAGGTMPSLIQRFGIGPPQTIADNLAGTAAVNSRLYHLRRFYYDTAQSTNPVQMQGLKLVEGASQIVFGTDYPFGSAARHLQGLEKCGFSAAELAGIHRENAVRVLPKFSR